MVDARMAGERGARFLAEAKVVNQISHPNLIEVTDFCDTGDEPYFVMELLTGETLEQVLAREGALSLARLEGAIPIGLVTGLLVFVPYIGSFTGLRRMMFEPKFGKSFALGGSNWPDGLTLSVV